MEKTLNHAKGFVTVAKERAKNWIKDEKSDSFVLSNLGFMALVIVAISFVGWLFFPQMKAGLTYIMQRFMNNAKEGDGENWWNQ